MKSAPRDNSSGDGGRDGRLFRLSYSAENTLIILDNNPMRKNAKSLNRKDIMKDRLIIE
jgi:hypothetical protein